MIVLSKEAQFMQMKADSPLVLRFKYGIVEPGSNTFGKDRVMRTGIALLTTLLLAVSIQAETPTTAALTYSAPTKTDLNKLQSEHAAMDITREAEASKYTGNSVLLTEEPHYLYTNRDGDTIEDAIPMAVGDCVNNNTSGFSNDYDEACPYEGSTSADVVYTFFLDHTATLEFDMCNAQYDCKVYVYNAALALMGCNDDACESPQGDPYRSFLTIPDMPIDEYYVVCDGYGGENGTFELCVTEGEPAEYDIHQQVHTPGDAWSAGTSHTNGSDVDYLRADRFGNAGYITEITVWGLSLTYDSGWYACSEDPMLFEVIFYELSTMPGNVVASFDISSSPVPTGDTYAGYMLYEFNFALPEPVDLIEGWFSLQTHVDCWFLWMSAYEVDGWSALSSNDGPWESYDYDLSYSLTISPGSPPQPPLNLSVELQLEGEVFLQWEEPEPNINYYTIYRDGDFVNVTAGTDYTDQLPGHGTFCYTVTATNAYGESEPAGPECVDWVPEPVHFTPVDPTGLPYSIVVTEAWLDDAPLQADDEIGIFDGELCVGAGVVNDWPLPITAWEGDPGQGLPGFTPGNPIAYRVWSDGNATEYPAEASYQVGNGTFGYGPYSEVTVICNVYPDIMISSPDHDFGTVLVDMTSYWTLFIYNIGGNDLNVSAIISDNGVFATDFYPPAVIAPDSWLEVEVSFTPNAPELFEGTLTIISDDPDEGSIDVALTGEGSTVPFPDISLPDSEHDFGEVLVGENETWEFSIHNVGSTDLEVTEISSNLSVFTTDFSPRLTIPPGGSTDVTVTFTPTDPITYEGALTIISDDPDEPAVQVELTGQGLGIQPPTPFSLLAPPDDSSQDVPITFVWETSTDPDGGAITYLLLLSTTPDFADTTLAAETVNPMYYLEELESGDYWWRVLAQDDNTSGTWSTETWTFGIAGQPPTPFDLLTPADGAIVTTSSPTLTWEESTDPDSPEPVTYTLFWDTDPGFVSADSVAGLTATEYTLEGLEDDTEYFWRVWAHDLNTTGTPCDTDFSFTVGIPEPPLPFSLLAPPDGNTLGPPLTFVWQTAEDPDPGDEIVYLLLLSPDQEFNDTTLAVETDDPMYYLEELDPGEFWWRVLAQDGNTVGTWSTETWSFMIPDGVFDDLEGIPTSFSIVSIYPNPFNPSTHIAFGMPAAGQVEAEIYDLTGRLTDTRVLGLCQPGYHQFTWSPEGSSGIYFLCLRSDQGWRDVKRMLYLK